MQFQRDGDALITWRTCRQPLAMTCRPAKPVDVTIRPLRIGFDPPEDFLSVHAAKGTNHSRGIA